MDRSSYYGWRTHSLKIFFIFLFFRVKKSKWNVQDVNYFIKPLTAHTFILANVKNSFTFDFFLLFKNTTRQSGDCSYRHDGNLLATDTIPVPTLNRLVKCNCQQCHTVWRMCTECGHRRINFYCFTGGQNNLHAHELVCDHCNFSRTLPRHKFDCPYIWNTISLMFFKQECLFRSNTFVQVRMHMLKEAIECSCIHCEHFWKTCPFCRTRSMTLRCSSRYREHIHPYGCRRCPFYFPIGFNDEPWCPFTEPQIEVRPPERRTLEQIVQDP